jgi:hypothetical protein
VTLIHQKFDTDINAKNYILSISQNTQEILNGNDHLRRQWRKFSSQSWLFTSSAGELKVFSKLANLLVLLLSKILTH